MNAASAFLADLWNLVIRNTQYEQAIGERVDAFLKTWPSGADAKLLAKKLFETVGHRDEVVVFISALFAAGTAAASNRIPLRYLIERHVDSIGLSAQNPARSTDISVARILGLNHRLFET